MQASQGFKVSSGAESVDLHKGLAAAPSGWTARDLPIGGTEYLQKATENTLRFDSWFLREYERAGVSFTIYAAYWRPGKHPPQMITQHTPDRCWTLNGMTCEEMRFNVPAMVEGQTLWPAQWRKFRDLRGNITYTMFWHMVGERPYDFGERFYDMPDPVTFWSEALRFATGPKPAQFFFRVTSNIPFEQLWLEPGFQKAIKPFTGLGLKRI